MTFEQIRVLHAVVSEGSFRAAAQVLFKSQPALSNMVKNLEQELGIKLLSREKYRPVLTPQGQVFYEKALQVLQQMNQLSGLAKRLCANEEPLLTLSVNAVCPLSDVLELLQTLENEYPATQIKLSTEHMGGAMERLYEEQADIIISTHTDMDASIMEAQPYRTVKIIPVAHKDYVPAQTQSMKSSEDMQPYVQVVVADSSQTRRKQSLDLMPDSRRWVVTDFVSKKEIIMRGMGWGGLPEYLIERELASGELVRLFISDFAIRDSQLYAIRRKDKPVGVVADAIWKALGSVTQE